MCAAEGLPLSNLALFKAPFRDPIDLETGQGDVFPDFTFGTFAVEVGVDTETGQVTVLKNVACHDVGRAINPAAVIGQIQGGSYQGLGYALMENLIVENGEIKTPSLSEYLVPTAVDYPTTQVILLESGTGGGAVRGEGHRRASAHARRASGGQRRRRRAGCAHLRTAADAGTGVGGPGASRGSFLNRM
jgi:hypothetical protein